jgi:hypothetical protein
MWFWHLKRKGRLAARYLWQLLTQLCHTRKVNKVTMRKSPVT